MPSLKWIKWNWKRNSRFKFCRQTIRPSCHFIGIKWNRESMNGRQMDKQSKNRQTDKHTGQEAEDRWLGVRTVLYLGSLCLIAGDTTNDRWHSLQQTQKGLYVRKGFMSSRASKKLVVTVRQLDRQLSLCLHRESKVHDFHDHNYTV